MTIDDVITFQRTTFHVVYKNVPAALTLDWTDGFLLKPFASTTFAFTYNFSQLKGSSDDGNATLKLQFRSLLQGQDLVEHVSYYSLSTGMQEINCPYALSNHTNCFFAILSQSSSGYSM